MKFRIKSSAVVTALGLALSGSSAYAVDSINLCGGAEGKAFAAGVAAVVSEAARLCTIGDVTDGHGPAPLVHANSAKISGNIVTGMAIPEDKYGDLNCHFKLGGVEVNNPVPVVPAPADGYTAIYIEAGVNSLAGGQACPN